MYHRNFYSDMTDLRQTLKKAFTPDELLLETAADLKVLKVSLSDTQAAAST